MKTFRLDERWRSFHRTPFSPTGLELEKGIYEKTLEKAKAGARGIYVNHAVIVVKKLRGEVARIVAQREKEEEMKREEERQEEVKRREEKEKELADAAMARQLAAEEEAEAKAAGTWKPKHADPSTREFLFRGWLGLGSVTVE